MNSVARFYGEPVTRSAFWPFDPGTLTSSGTTQVNQPYRVSTWVQAAIKLVAKPITEVPLQFFKDKSGGVAVKDPKLELFWNKPAIGPDRRPLCFSDACETSVISLKLCGEFFWIFDARVLIPRAALAYPEMGTTPQRFQIARPDRMRHVIEGGELKSWEATDASGRKTHLDPKQVLHYRLPNPYDDWRGLSEYDACRIAAESDYLASSYKRNLWAQSGNVGSVISIENGMQPTPDQQLQIQAQLRERREMAARGIIKDIVMGGVKIEKPSVQMVDSAFVESRPQDWHQVAIAFGVPPSMFEVVASYSVGSASDWFRLIRGTCVPTAKILTEAIEAAQELLGQPIYAGFDWSKHPVMQQVMAERMATARDLFDRGWSWLKINEWLGLGMPEFEGWELRYLPFNVQPAEMAGEDMTQDPALAEDDEAEAPEMEQEGLCEDGGTPFVAKASDPATARWNKMMRARRPAWKKYTVAFRSELFKARQDVLAKLDTIPRSEKAHAKATAMELFFDPSRFARGLIAAFKGPAIFALNAGGNEVRREIGEDADYEMAPFKVTQHLKERENKIVGMANEVFEQVRDVIQEGFDAGDSTKEIADNLRERFNEIGKARAKVIAITETAVNYGEARIDSMKESGVPFKKWLTSKGPTVRPSHKAMEGKTVPVGDDFTVGGQSMSGPGDPKGTAKEVCGCHCIAIAVMKETGEIDA